MEQHRGVSNHITGQLKRAPVPIQRVLLFKFKLLVLFTFSFFLFLEEEYFCLFGFESCRLSTWYLGKCSNSYSAYSFYDMIKD